jgi:hypothetical protein
MSPGVPWLAPRRDHNHVLSAKSAALVQFSVAGEAAQSVNRSDLVCHYRGIECHPIEASATYGNGRIQRKAGSPNYHYLTKNSRPEHLESISKIGLVGSDRRCV